MLPGCSRYPLLSAYEWTRNTFLPHSAGIKYPESDFKKYDFPSGKLLKRTSFAERNIYPAISVFANDKK